MVAFLNLTAMNEQNEKSVTGDIQEDDIRDLLISIRYFFVNYTPEDLKKIFWDFYKAWTMTLAEHQDRETLTDMIIFYEALLAFMEDTYSYCKQREQTSAAGSIDKLIL